jgi:hypothetical protein
MKTLLWGVLLIIVLGIGGLVYRNAIEHPSQPIVCPMDAQVCPDGTSVSRTGSSCTFPDCPLPNVSLPTANIAFAIPTGFTVGALNDDASIAEYDMPIASSTDTNSIIIRRYAIGATSTALATIQQTAIGGASGAPVGASSFSSIVLGAHRFTVVSIQRFEGVIDTAYYLARNTDVLRFDAIDRGADWTNPDLDISTLPAHAALAKMLTTLQGQ